MVGTDGVPFGVIDTVEISSREEDGAQWFYSFPLFPFAEQIDAEFNDGLGHAVLSECLGNQASVPDIICGLMAADAEEQSGGHGAGFIGERRLIVFAEDLNEAVIERDGPAASMCIIAVFPVIIVGEDDIEAPEQIREG